MNRFFTIFLCVLAVGAIVFLAIYEPLTRSTRERELALKEGRVLDLNPQLVREIRLSSPSGEIEIKRRGNMWQMSPKPKDRVSTEFVKKLLETARELKFTDLIPAAELRNDTDWGEYGLRNPKRKIEFKGAADVTLYLGKDAANEDRLYVRTSASRDVYVVPDDILEQAFAEPSTFRDRRLTDLKPEQVDRFIIRKSDGDVEVTREVDGWKVTRPLNAAANTKTVTDFLNRVLGMRILEFVSDDSGDLSALGIAEGVREIAFFAEGSERRQSLRIGGTNEGKFYGQFTARDSVYLLPASAGELLSFTPESFRDRNLLPLNLDVVDLIRFSSPGGTFALRRDGEGWKLKVGSASRPASDAAIQALVDALGTTEVKSFTPASSDKLTARGLVPPQGKVEFFSVVSENTPEVPAGERLVAGLTLGKVENGKISVRLADAPEIASVPESALRVISFDPAAWAASK